MAKVMISVPDALLEQIDREASRRGVSRSRLLREAAARDIGRPDPVAIEAALARGRAIFADAPAIDSAELMRQEKAERDARDRRHS